MHDVIQMSFDMQTSNDQIPQKTFALSFCATETAVSQAVQTVRQSLSDDSVEKDTLGRIELALAEALNNIVEHSYAKMALGQVHLTVCILTSDIKITLHDTGVSVPERLLTKPALPDSSGPLQRLPEGGFGWVLIHELSDGVFYSREGSENQLCLQFFRPKR